MTHLNQEYCLRNASAIVGSRFLEVSQKLLEFERFIRTFRCQFNQLLFLKKLMFYGDTEWHLDPGNQDCLLTEPETEFYIYGRRFVSFEYGVPVPEWTVLPYLMLTYEY